MWNYRILQYEDGEYGLHEVYYDDEGRPEGCTEDALLGPYERPTDLLWDLENIKEALRKEIIRYDKFSGKGEAR